VLVGTRLVLAGFLLFGEGKYEGCFKVKGMLYELLLSC
jgi:hypothetical protein